MVDNQNYNHWISVTDYMPPFGDRILLTDGVGVWEGYLSYSTGFMRNTGLSIKDIFDTEVTHWMRLPLPPEDNCSVISL